MASAPAITIRRETVDVEVRGTEADALALQARLPELCTAVLAPALESALRGVDPGDDHLCIERLEIDLDAVPADALERSLGEAVRRQVAEWLRRYVAPLSRADATAAGDVSVRSAAAAVDDALVVFLRTGRLPWAFRAPPGGQLETIVLAAWSSRPATDSTRTAPDLARLRAVLGEPNARARLLLQFTPEFVAALVRRVAPPSAATIDEILAVVGRGEVPGPLRDRFTSRLGELVVADASVGRTRTAADLVRAAWSTRPALDDRTGALAAVLEQHWPGATAPPDSDADGVLRLVPGTNRKVDGAAASARVHLGEGEALLVDNAGVVLLHPFVPRLLTGVGLAAGDELADAGRAVGLLDHLVTGELTAPEHRVTLAKVLCGLALDEPVPADVGLTDVEVEEAAAVLDAAIAHWPALRNTSPEGLRNEFLKRPGMLARDSDGAWLLRVETSTVDILLDRLPWSVSMFRLPWMPRMMRVEWR